MIPSRFKPLAPARPYPVDAGPGFRFLRVGELIKKGDEYYNREGRWVRAFNVGGIVSVASRNHYRRAA